eukprot:m.212988 g.212988  ORF g.212988 m.212988 type:complete len:124 (+) comp26163_c0_seq34:286-657(+)
MNQTYSPHHIRKIQHFYPPPFTTLHAQDMRPSIGAYNFSMAHTPNMDAFAERSLLFQRAYVQYSFCAPSRNSFMTGYRPDTTRCWEFEDHFREPGVGADWVAFPEYFKKNGYLTLGAKPPPKQ